jgi:hypothetical protein
MASPPQPTIAAEVTIPANARFIGTRSPDKS